MQQTMQQTVQTKSPASGLLGGLRNSIQQLLAVASLVLIVIVFAIINPGTFLTLTNMSTILTAVTTVGILALGVTFVIITGGIDLSIGTGMILCGVMAGVFVTNLGLPVFLGILLTIVFGAILGLINGFNIAVLHLPPFIATLGMMMVTQGLSLVISGTKPIYFTDTPSFGAIMNHSLVPGMRLPVGGVVFVVLIVIAWVMLQKTLVGRNAFAIGSNEKATALSGVNVKRWLVGIYVLCGVFVGIAGVLSASRLSSAQPTGGAGVELQAIAAVIIGGTSMTGGRGSIVGTVIGALIMAVLDNGLRMAGVAQEWQQVAIGVVVLVAVYLDIVRKRSSSSS
ncbi:ABC transporter permease [Brevibacterium sp. 50QC2O2]|uniref:ABC transporter permease n=1 Tax=Brevibacterium sp. 50QC2O2 TaxID=2968459 RepID=UPI00211CEC81|nr:ABC transporter permease [Brevibacterium sp. 50QC2O2]MCQ9388179.1 ABC transporter permease [Brevibacterium sp. 50QC2O2]